MGLVRGLAAVASGVLVAVGPAFVADAKADRIFVRNGGAIRGKAIVDEAHPDQYLVVGEKGKTPVVLKRDRVVRVEAEPGILDDYAMRRKAMGLAPAAKGPTAAQAEYDLGLWAEEHKLVDLAAVHYEGAARRDPAFGPAHQRLGHVEHEGKWLTPAELKAAQGYILYKGRWITPEEKDQRDAEATVTADQQSWMKRLGILRQAIANGPEARAIEAEAQLMQIREAAAVRPILRTFGSDEDPALRKVAARALGAIPGPESAAGLVARLLAEPDDEVRQATMDALARTREPAVIGKLVNGLKSPSTAVINRAAWALGNLNAVAAAPKLVPVLVSTEYQMVWVPQSNSTEVAFAGGVPAGGAPQGFGVSGGRSIPVLTGPVVGPGVVAFGATSVPASSFAGTGLSLGGGIGGGSRGPVPTYVAVARQNVEVRAALMKLTGKDFGYDGAAWRRWLSTAFRPDPGPAKLVPQP